MTTLTKEMLTDYDRFEFTEGSLTLLKGTLLYGKIIYLPVKQLAFCAYKKGLLHPLDKQLFIAAILTGETTASITKLFKYLKEKS